MQQEYSITKVEATRFTDTSPIVVTFFYLPHKDKSDVVLNTYTQKGISSEMIDHNTRKFATNEDQALEIIPALKSKNAVDPKLADEIIANITTGNIGRPQEYPITKIEATRPTDNSPIKVEFFYNPHGVNFYLVIEAIQAVDPDMESGMVHNNLHRVKVNEPEALAIITELKKRNAVDSEMADRIANNITTKTNIGSGGSMFVTRTHDGNSADMLDK